MNENVSELINENLDKINWYWISESPVIFEIDYDTLYKYIEPYKEELIQNVYHPKKLWYYLDNYNYDIGSDEYNADY